LKRGKTWLTTLLVCTQILTSTPLFAAADTIEGGLAEQQTQTVEPTINSDETDPVDESYEENTTSQETGTEASDVSEEKKSDDKENAEKEEAKDTASSQDSEVKKDEKQDTTPKQKEEKADNATESTEVKEAAKKETSQSSDAKKDNVSKSTSQTDGKAKEEATKKSQAEQKTEKNNKQTKETKKAEQADTSQDIKEDTQKKNDEQKTNQASATAVEDHSNENTTIAEAQPNNDAGSFAISPEQDTWDFIHTIGEDAREIGQKEDLYASIMIAQAVLESDSGHSQLSQSPYFNLFGIKGKGVSMPTAESDDKGQFYSTTSSFRQYKSYEESLQDYADLLKEGISTDKAFYQGAWKSETENYQAATQFLTGRYATDPHYNEKLNEIITTYDLTSYDEAEKKITTENGDYLTPVQNPTVTSQYGKRESGFHRGIDLAVAQGTLVKAAKDGEVIQSEYHPSWGNYVAIKHADGLTTLYAHCSRNVAQVGQTIKQGETIAFVGSTGHSTGPHLHFEVNQSQNLEQDQLLNPLQVLNING